eukprot:g2553.t1
MQEVQAARSRRKQKVNQPEEVAEDSSTSSRQKASRSQNLLQAIARDPLVFDPLQGNAGAGGLSLDLSPVQPTAKPKPKSGRCSLRGVDGWKDVLGFEELGVRVAGKCNKKLPKKLGLMFG